MSTRLSNENYFFSKCSPSPPPLHTLVSQTFDSKLATIGTTYLTTAILEAGRLSLDAKGRPFDIMYRGNDKHIPTEIEPVEF